MDILQIAFLSIPFALALGLAAAIVMFGGAVIGRPIVPLMLYLVVYFTFAQSNYGSLDVRPDSTVYFRGTGLLFFPALLWALLIAVAWTGIGRQFSNAPPPPATPVLGWLWAWLALLLAHTAWGLIAGQDIFDILSINGFVLLPWMLPLIVLMLWSARDEESLSLMAHLLVLAALAKSVFGLGRWAFFGGDRANVYRNVSRIDIKLTYFDICDNLVMLLGVAVAVSFLLVRRETGRARAWSLVYAVTVPLALACITMSFRRTAWLGMALAALLLLWHMKAHTRLLVMLAGLPLLATGVVYAASMRLGARSRTSGLAGFIYDLTGNRFGAESQRALELRLAWDSFASSPVVGIGSWGHYASSKLIAWQEQTSGAFVHSGILLIAMKSGLVGLLLLGGLVWAFVRHVRRLPREMSPSAKALVIAGCCGLLFMLPDVLIGTPFRQTRTTQLLALCLGLPFMVSVVLRSTRHGR